MGASPPGALRVPQTILEALNTAQVHVHDPKATFRYAHASRFAGALGPLRRGRHTSILPTQSAPEEPQR